MLRTTTTLPATAVPPVRHPEAPPPGSALGSHYSRCFGCGQQHPTGLHLELWAGQGVDISAELVVSEHHQGAPGLAHGGLLAAAFDEALGAVNWLLRRPSVTAHLDTDFRRPVPVGSRLFITARCDGIDGRKTYLSAEGRLDAPDGPLAVTAAAVFVQVPLDHFTTFGRREDVEAARALPAERRYREVYEVNP